MFGSVFWLICPPRFLLVYCLSYLASYIDAPRWISGYQTGNSLNVFGSTHLQVFAISGMRLMPVSLQTWSSRSSPSGGGDGFGSIGNSEPDSVKRNESNR